MLTSVVYTEQCCASTYIYKERELTKGKHTLYFKIKLSQPWNLRSLVMFHTLSVERNVQGKHLQICTCMCVLLNITDWTLPLPQWMGPEDTSALRMISPHLKLLRNLIFTYHNNKNHVDSNPDYTVLSQVSAQNCLQIHTEACQQGTSLLCSLVPSSTFTYSWKWEQKLNLWALLGSVNNSSTELIMNGASVWIWIIQ